MARPPANVQADPFRFGWRYARRSGRNGHTEPERIPLTPEDVLHPQEGDQIPENTIQERDRTYLTTALRSRLADNATALVLSDCLVDWGVPGLRNHSPDICVMANVTDPDRGWTTFRVVAEGGRPVLAIEIVSVHDDDPEIRDNDVVTKVEQYYRAGVPLYVIVDQEREGGPRRLLGYRRGKRRYQQLSLDAQGRLLLEPVGVLLGLRDNRAVCFDAATETEIPDLTGMARARDAEALARQQAEQARDAEAEARRQAEASLAEARARIQELESQGRPRRRSPRGRAP